LNALQSYSSSGKIDSGILVNQVDAQLNELVVALKAKNFTDMRKWVGTNSDIEPLHIFKGLYEKTTPLLSPRCLPSIVVTLGDYLYKCSQVADTELLITACLAVFAAEAEWV
jgi:hypothetical protein